MAAPILQQKESLMFRPVAWGAHSALSNRPERLFFYVMAVTVCSGFLTTQFEMAS